MLLLSPSTSKLTLSCWALLVVHFEMSVDQAWDSVVGGVDECESSSIHIGKAVLGILAEA